jgi:AAA+ ATPase superfamily predicted ATPase
LLTKKQQEVFDEILHSIEKKQNYFLSSEDRRIGKTFTLNELAFNLQALGYRVFILTPYQDQEYFADGFISIYSPSYRGRLDENTVIILPMKQDMK